MNKYVCILCTYLIISFELSCVFYSINMFIHEHVIVHEYHIILSSYLLNFSPYFEEIHEIVCLLVIELECIFLFNVFSTASKTYLVYFYWIF